MTGVTKEKDGSYAYRIKKVLPNGDKVDTKRKGFATQREAAKARAERLAELTGGVAPGRIRVDALFAEFLDREARGSRKYATILRYESLHRNHISPAFGSRFADSVTAAELTRFLRDKYRAGLSYGYIQSIHKQLCTLYRYALRNHRVTANPTEQAVLPQLDLRERREQAETVKVFTEDEFMRLAERLRGTSSLTPMLLGYYMGLRVSEAYAVRWRDVDWTHATLRIDKQLQYQDHMWCLVPPKSFRGYRELAIPAPLLQHLDQSRKEQQRQRSLYAAAYRRTQVRLRLATKQNENAWIDDFICVKKNGSLLTPSSAKYITQAARELGLTHYRFHYLRHTHASILANCNISTQLLKERLGHERVETVWAFYTHATQAARDELQRVLNQMPSST